MDLTQSIEARVGGIRISAMSPKRPALPEPTAEEVAACTDQQQLTAIEFEIPGEPASKSRARFTKRGSKVHAFTPERTRQAEQAVASAYLSATRRSNKSDRTTAFAVHAEFHLAKHQRRDVDNMLKLVLDGLNEVAWEDDHQVVEVIGRKHYDAGLGRTVVRIIEMGTIPRSESSCEHCGKTFPRPPSHAAKKYCTAACRKAGLAAKRTRACEQCGAKFVRHGDVSQQRYCSTKCAYESKKIPATCVRCGTDFLKPRHLNRSGNSYCSPECKAGYWRERRKGAAKGTCQDCGGPTSKKTYVRCLDCNIAAGGAWVNKKDGAA